MNAWGVWMFVVGLAGAGCSLELPDEKPLAESSDFSETAQKLTSVNGLKWSNGLRFSNGFKLPNGVKLTNGFNLANGVNSANGIKWSNGAVLDGKTGPYLAPPAGSDLEKWIDSSATNNLRVLRYLIECTLPAGAAARVKYRGITYTYAGLAGLGPTIQASALTAAEQEKVSACMLARVNYEGQTVQLDLFGPMPGFTHATSLSEVGMDYPFPEAAFFGNLFLSTPVAYACGVKAMDPRGFRACSRTDGTCGVIQTQASTCRNLGCSSATIYFSGTQATSETYISSCPNVGGQSWNYPVTARLALVPYGGQCFVDEACESGMCDPYQHVCTSWY